MFSKCDHWGMLSLFPYRDDDHTFYIYILMVMLSSSPSKVDIIIISFNEDILYMRYYKKENCEFFRRIISRIFCFQLDYLDIYACT